MNTKEKSIVAAGWAGRQACRRTLVVAGLALAANFAGAASVGYVITELPGLGGATTGVRGINSVGQVVGVSELPGRFAATHAALWSGGVLTDLGTIVGGSAYANAINSAGQAVGYTYDGYSRATLWSGGAMVQLDTLGTAEERFDIAYGINNAAQVVGMSWLGDGIRRATLWSGGAVAALGTLGGTQSWANGINNAGQVVGWSNTLGDVRQHATLWSNGVAIDLEDRPGGGYSEAHGINDAGQVVGWSYPQGASRAHATLWSGGVATDLGSGFLASEAYGINAMGQIVGISMVSGGSAHATLWSDGLIVDLNNVLPSADRAAGWVFGGGLDRSLAPVINDSGQIALTATNRTTGFSRAYLLTPTAAVPEPASWALMLGGFAVIVVTRRRQRRHAG